MGQLQLAHRPLCVLALIVVEVLQQQDPVEVVELVLDDPGKELVGFELDVVAVEVQSGDADLLRAHDVPVQTWDRQAAFGELPFARRFGDHRVDQHLSPVAFAEVVDEEALLHTNLRRGQTHARSVVHGVEHVVGQFDQAAVDVGDLRCALSEHRIADDADAIGARHDRKATVTPVPGPSHPSPSDAANGGQYFSERPTSPSRPSEVHLVLPDTALRLRTDAGVFSPTRVDPGTKLLLLELPPVAQWPAGDIADVGCGYGPIAVTLATRLVAAESARAGGDNASESMAGSAPSTKPIVWAIDVNERARSLCRANADAAGVGDRVRVVAPDEVPSELRVAMVVSNPPIRVGKAVLHDLCTTWLERLSPGGEAWWVVQKHLGSDSLQSWLAAQGWPTERVRSRQSYRVLRSAR